MAQPRLLLVEDDQALAELVEFRFKAEGYGVTRTDDGDEALLLRLAREHEVLITVEEGSVGGFGAFVLHALASHGALDRGLKIRTLTLPDIFQDHDKAEIQYMEAGLDADSIARAALEALGGAEAAAALRA